MDDTEAHSSPTEKKSKLDNTLPKKQKLKQTPKVQTETKEAPNSIVHLLFYADIVAPPLFLYSSMVLLVTSRFLISHPLCGPANSYIWVPLLILP